MVNEAYWNSATVNAHVALVGRMLFMISLGFFFYDLILSFPFDWSIISGKRQRRLPQLAYFGTKFLLICFFIVNFVVNFAYHEINCTVALEMVEMVMGFTVVTSSILLACRTVCVYEGPTQKFVTFTLTILTCGLLAAWMADVDSVTIYWAPGQGDPWTDGACVQERISNSYWVKYVCTIIFDGIVLFLTIFGLLQMSGPSHIGAVLLRQGIIYFLITFIANLLITILTLLKLSPVMSLVIAIPQTTICVIAACRLYINLADEARSAHEASQQSYADRLRYSGGGGGLAGGIESARPITTSNKQSSTQSSNSRSKQQSNSRKSRLTNYLFRKDGGVQETAVPSYFSSSSDPTNPNGAVTRTRNGNTTAIPQHPLIREKENENSQGSSQETHNQHPQQQKLPVVPSVQTMQNRLNLQNHQNSYPASTSNHPSDEDLEKQASRSNLSVNQTERFYDPPQTPSGIAIHQQQQGDDELPTTRGGGGSYFTQPNNTQQQQPQLTARIPPRNSSGVHHHHQGQRLRTLPVSSVHQDDGVQVETVNYVVVEDAPAYTPPLSQSNHQTRYASPRPYNPYDVNSSNRRNGNGRSQQQPPQDDDEVVIHQAQQPRFTAVRREPSHA